MRGGGGGEAGERNRTFWAGGGGGKQGKGTETFVPIVT